MSGIRLENQGEHLQDASSAPGAFPLAPTTTATLFSFIAKNDGELIESTFVVATDGALGGTTTDILETLKVNKNGWSASGSGEGAVVQIGATTNVMKKVAPAKTPLAGELIRVRGLAGNRVKKGEIITIVWTESGTTTGITRPKLNYLGSKIRYIKSIDPAK